MVLWIITKHFACFFLARRNQYKCGEVVFVFKVNTYQIRQYISLPSIVVIIVIAAEQSVITLVVNMSTCKYNWKGFPRSFIPKLVLYISRPFSKFHSRPLIRKECLSIDFIALIPQKLTISSHQHWSPPLLIKSWQNVTFSVQRHCF